MVYSTSGINPADLYVNFHPLKDPKELETVRIIYTGNEGNTSAHEANVEPKATTRSGVKK